MTNDARFPQGKHRDERSAAAERYGKHSQAHASVPVLDMLHRVVARGEAIRLAWRDAETNSAVQDSPELPTTVLPAIRPHHKASPDPDDDTEPTSATRAARQRSVPSDFSWWPMLLAG